MAIQNNNPLDISGLDYRDVLSNLKNFLKTDNRFTDYNFEGSNLSVLLSLLAYNTHYLAVYLYFVSQEMFLGSATQRQNVVMHAKDFGYVPHSRISARANVNITLTSPIEMNGSVILQKWTQLTTFGIQPLTFIVSKNYMVNWASNVATFEDVVLIEGKPSQVSYVVDGQETIKKFVLPTGNLDLSTLDVVVQDSVASNVQNIYRRVDSFVELNSESLVWFVKELDNGLYEISFGDGVFGKALDIGNIVIFRYVVSSGVQGNDVNRFRLTYGSYTTNVTLTDTESGGSYGGSEKEEIESIRQNSTEWFGSQKRSVIAADYKSCVTKEYPWLDVVGVWGGEDNEPKIYGAVFICVKSKTSNILSPSQKKQISDTLIKKYNVVTVRPVIVSPEFILVNVNSTIQYDPNVTLFDDIALKLLTQATINQYFEQEVANILEYSRLISAIDNTNSAVLNNQTKLTMQVQYLPIVKKKESIIINFGNNPIKRLKNSEIGTLLSTNFIFNGKTVQFIDNPKTQKIMLSSGGEIIDANVGSINYLTSVIQINPINITSFDGTEINFICESADQNLYSNTTKILKLNSMNISVVSKT